MARIVLVTGSRDHLDPVGAEYRLRIALGIINPDLILNGGARGTDSWATQWGHDNAVQVEIYRPTDDEIQQHGHKGCYIARDKRMVEVLGTYDSGFHERVVLGQPANPRLIQGGTGHTLGFAAELDDVTIFILD